MTDSTQRLSNESMQEQMANAWWKVATTLDLVSPGWETRCRSGADAACVAIRDLAQYAQLTQSKLDVIANYPITDPENQDAVNMAAVARGKAPKSPRHVKLSRYSHPFSST